MCKKKFFYWQLESHLRKEQDPDPKQIRSRNPVYKDSDPNQNVTDPEFWFQVAIHCISESKYTFFIWPM
jgi:hypothetical protein